MYGVGLLTYDIGIAIWFAQQIKALELFSKMTLYYHVYLFSIMVT